MGVDPDRLARMLHGLGADATPGEVTFSFFLARSAFRGHTHTDRKRG